MRANIIDGVDFGTIPDVLHELAKQALRDRDARRFLCLTDNMDGLGLVNRNSRLLLDLGIYEEALLDAWTGCRLNYHQFPLSTMKFLFAIANRDKLRAAGEALPQTGPFTLYRGVAGIGRARRIRGWSWTASLPIAQWFAARSFSFGAPNPAVNTITVQESNVLAYLNERQENEFIVDVSDTVKISRIQGLSFESFGEIPQHQG